MTKKIAILLAIGGLTFGATACNDEKPEAKASPSTAGTPAASAPAAAPSTSAPPKPAATKPKITQSKQIVMIDPDGKRYTFTTMVQMAAGMRATMGDHAPSGFCEKSYAQGVKEGGEFPAGRSVFLAACREGWRKAAHPPQ
ncbi:hypothetical protein [Actinomadura darangshiensis]|uniref:hypothetical protein n=1 Tax=Actinomadura darangshiensis TaxID=705336 RepID=UPI00140CCAAF|nr:hypothetical protein [Actinomadura darangshiensis]